MRSKPNDLDPGCGFSLIRVPQCLTAQDWIWAKIPEPDFLLGEVFSTTSRALVAAPTGLGKTMLFMAAGLAMSEGQNFLHWQARRDGPAKVLFVDGEMSQRLTKRRILDALRRTGFDPDGAYPPHYFNVFCLDELPMRPPPLNTRAGHEYFERVISSEGYEFVIFDNSQALLTGNLGEEDPWKATLPLIHGLTRRAIGQLWIDHTGHDKSRAYGSATKSWQMDASILLEEITDRPWADIALRLKFLKARERTPENRDDFEPVIITPRTRPMVCREDGGGQAQRTRCVATKAKTTITSRRTVACRAR